MKIFKRVVVGLVAVLVVSVAVYMYLWLTPVVSEREIQDSNPLCSYLKMDVRYDRYPFDRTIVINFYGDKHGTTHENALALTYISYQLRHKEIDSVILSNAGQPMLSLPVELIRILGKSNKYEESDLFDVQKMLAFNARYVGGDLIYKSVELPSVYREPPKCALDSLNLFSYDEWEYEVNTTMMHNFWSVLFKLDQNKK